RSKAAAVVSRNGAAAKAPALLTRTSTRPKRFPTAAASAATAASSATSAGNTSATAGAQVRATARRFRSFRATRARRAPGTPRATARAIAAPMPCDAPVTITTGPAPRRGRSVIDFADDRLPLEVGVLEVEQDRQGELRDGQVADHVAGVRRGEGLHHHR